MTKATAEPRYGPVDCLVNHSAVMLLDLVKGHDSAEWKNMLHVNVVAALDTIHVVLQSMIARERGARLSTSVSLLAARPSQTILYQVCC